MTGPLHPQRSGHRAWLTFLAGLAGVFLAAVLSGRITAWSAPAAYAQSGSAGSPASPLADALTQTSTLGLPLAGGTTIHLPLVINGPGVAPSGGFALRFYGHGTGDIDRVKIKIDNPARPVDVGSIASGQSGDFTLEFWLKAILSENDGSVTCNANDGWITGNIIFDRDVFNAGDYGDYGIALGDGRIGFGVNNGSDGTVRCGATNVADGAWHHVAVTRNGTTGELRIYMDGQLDNASSTSGPTGDLSYQDGRGTSFPNSDPYLVIGAEKHDYDNAQYPSFSGWVDEARISNMRRYTSNFTPPAAPFTPDANTMALYHFDEGPAGPCAGTVTDSSGAAGGPSSGTCKYGGGGTAGPVYVTDTPFP